MAHTGWTEAQLEAMTSADRHQSFNTGTEIDLREASPEQAREALDRIRVSLRQH